MTSETIWRLEVFFLLNTLEYTIYSSRVTRTYQVHSEVQLFPNVKCVKPQIVIGKRGVHCVVHKNTWAYNQALAYWVVTSLVGYKKCTDQMWHLYNLSLPCTRYIKHEAGLKPLDFTMSRGNVLSPGFKLAFWLHSPGISGLVYDGILIVGNPFLTPPLSFSSNFEEVSNV